MVTFNEEREMIYEIVNSMQILLDGNRSCAISTEVPVGHRLIDIMVASFTEDLQFEEMNPILANLKRLTHPYMVVLAYINMSKKASKWKISKELFIDEEILLNKYIRELEELGLISRVTKVSYSSGEWIKWCPIEIVSIEAKRDRWRNVLKQAVYNMNFSDYSYAALPKEFLRDKDFVRTAIGIEGVGVLSVDKGRGLSVEATAMKVSKKKEIGIELQKLKILKDMIQNRNRWSLTSIT